MKNGVIINTALALLLVGMNAAQADEIICKGKDMPFANSQFPVWGQPRNACDFTHAKPLGVEGWIKGWAKVDRNTGRVDVIFELSSDDVRKGPCGIVGVSLREKGKEIATLGMIRSACTGGKPAAQLFFCKFHQAACFGSGGITLSS